MSKTPKRTKAQLDRIGTMHRNTGEGLKVGQEWTTEDGYTARQTLAFQAKGYRFGTYQLVGFAGEKPVIKAMEIV